MLTFEIITVVKKNTKQIKLTEKQNNRFETERSFVVNLNLDFKFDLLKSQKSAKI